MDSEHGDTVQAQKKTRQTERELTTTLILLRVAQLGLSMADLDLLTVGMVLDMYAELADDDEDWAEIATQEDFDRF